MINRKPPVSPETALASDVFDQFCAATTLKSILYHHRHLCDILKIKPTNFLQFYPKLKAKLGSWKAQALWNKFDKRASHKCYNRGKACSQNKVLIIGAGPCGLRAAIEAQLLGARVVVVEKRDRITRNNVLHLWPFVIQDLRGLGAKKFFGKFCAGAIDHISIRQLQFILLKVALILGVEVHEGVAFESLIPPPANQDAEKIGWRAKVSPADHPVSQYEFDVLIGADGKRNTLEGFKRKEFRGKLAIAITANFINRRTEAEARVQEISGVAFIFNQKFFKDLYSDTGIDLENIVYYKDDTHYFVMTAKKHSLIDKGVILQDYADTARLLDPSNVDKDALLKYAKEAADFSTNYMLPDLDFAVNHHGQPDVAMFDFTSMYAAENASRVMERNGHKLLMLLVGDSLLEPFWPTGSGCARGFLSCMDACWVIKNWAVNGALSPLEVLAERESIYRLLGQTTPENLQKDPLTYTLDPHTRYPNLNSRSVLPLQVRNLFETDDPTSMELALAPTTTQEVPKKKRRKDSQVHPDTLLQWLKRQVCLHPDLHVENMTHSFKDGLILCAIISRYRPDLLDFNTLHPEDAALNNQRAFDILEKELGIPPVMTGEEMAECECPDRLTMLSYLSQVYDTFKGEIPHIAHHVQIPESEETEDDRAIANQLKTKLSRNSLGRKRHSGENLSKGDVSIRRSRKRRSGGDKLSFGDEERQRKLEEIEQNRQDRQARRRYLRQMQTEQFKKSLAMMQCNQWVPEEGSEGFQDYSLYVYRQTAPEFNNRVKELEMKLLYPDKESRLRAELRNRAANEPDEEFSGRIKDIEEKLLKGTTSSQKKPKDLLRAIGKIEKTDWNVKEIEKKIEENKYGRPTSHERPEKVPKWSRQHFDDKFQAMERKLLNKGLDQETASRYAEVDMSLKKLEQKLKDGSSLEIGQRGSNKVSAMAEQFAPKPEEKTPLSKSASKGTLVLPNQGGSEKCHFCNKRVYVMERVSAEGRFFHRSCFKCEYCGSTLRVGNYLFDKEGKYGNRFYCNQHFGLSGTIKQKLTRNQERAHRLALAKQKVKTPDKTSPGTIINKHLQTPPVTDTTDRGTTPERIEFENLAENASDLDDAPSEMDEDEWTDRNFGASAAECSSDDILDATDSEEEDQEDLLEEEALMTADETRKAAERWSRRHSYKSGSLQGSDENGQDSCEADDSDDFDEYSEDETDTATEGDEEEMRALELRKQEVRLQPQRHRQDTDTGSDTEVRPFESSSPRDETNFHDLPDLLSNNYKEKSIENSLPEKNSLGDFGRALQRSCTFSNRRFSGPESSPFGSNPISKSKSFVTRPDNLTDFKSSAPFEEKLTMFGATRTGRRMSNLETLLRNDMNESQKCRQDTEIDEEKYINKNLVLRRESLRKTNVLNPKTLEFQPKPNGNDPDRHRFSFVVVKNFSSSPEPLKEGVPSSNLNFGQDFASDSPSTPEGEFEVDKLFKNLDLKDDEVEKLTEKFDEITKSNCISVPQEEAKVDLENLEVDSDIDEFFQKLELTGESGKEKEIEEILNLFSDEGPCVKTREEECNDFEKHFAELAENLEDDFKPESGIYRAQVAVTSKEFAKVETEPEQCEPFHKTEESDNFEECFAELSKNLEKETRAEPEKNTPFTFRFPNGQLPEEKTDDVPPVRPRRTRGSRAAKSPSPGLYDNYTFKREDTEGGRERGRERDRVFEKSLPQVGRSRYAPVPYSSSHLADSRGAGTMSFGSPRVRPRGAKSPSKSDDENDTIPSENGTSSAERKPSGSRVKVASDDASTSEPTSEEIENSATEISTDSEFEHDGTTPTRHEIPDILITDHLRRNRPCEEPKKVQVKSGNIQKTNRNDGKGVRLEFSPLAESKSASVLTKNTLNSVLSKPAPLFNPRRGDYLLSKTQSTEGIATKMSLELRKKYLLGNTGSMNPISKSGSATILDSKLKNFASNITECQKLLNPANEISPTMQAFLQTSQKKPQPTSPTIITPPLNLPPTSMIFRKQKELPLGDKDFIHVCGKVNQTEEKSKVNVLNENVREKSIDAIRKQEDIDNRNEVDEENKENEGVQMKIEDKTIETPDCRPRSPVHETCILVPQIPWKVQNSSENLSDSLSESETETETSSSENEPKEERLKHQPPRLEIRNSKGELMDEEGFEPDSLQILEEEQPSPVSIVKQIELARSKIDELKSSIGRNDDEGEDSPKKIEQKEEKEPWESLGKSSLSLTLSKDKGPENGAKGSCPSSPGSVDESCNTFAALTETELSDWARDGDNCVSEDLDDVENKINIEESPERHKPKESKKPKSLNLQTDAFSHVCGKTDRPKLLASNENIDFMDTDVSEMESVSATNNALLQNRGYFRFVNEDDLETPVVEVRNIVSPDKTVGDSSSSSNSKSSSSSSKEQQLRPVDAKEDQTTEESTTSEQTTIKNSPVVNKNFDVNDDSFYSPLIDMSPITPTIAKSGKLTGLDIRPKSEILGKNGDFEEYVQQLQGRISPFHNVRDSIDYRKSKQKIEKADKVDEKAKIYEEEERKDDKLEASEEENRETPDNTIKKLKEISRERTLQKDLVHEMVLKKVLPGKKSPAERKNRKITRSGSRLSGTPLPNGEGQDYLKPETEPKENSEVPFVDKTPEVFYTPVTSFATGNKYSNLPDTPLTNPEAFNLPDVANFNFLTPVAPPRDKKTVKESNTADRDKFREEARARARLKSNEELGLSPEDKMKSIREKVSRLLESPVPKPEKNAADAPKKSDPKESGKKSNSLRKGDSSLPKSSSTSKVFDKLRGLEKSSLGLKSGQKSTSDLVSSILKNDEGMLKSPGSSGPSTSNSSGTKTESDKKRSRDRERRKSIIQAVSDFFHKKSPSPSKSPSPTKPDKFSAKFRLTAKPKDKKDIATFGGSELQPDLPPSPPSPGQPGFYKAQPFVSEESAGSECDEVFSVSTPTHGSTASVDAGARRARMTKRMARQAQMKRLRIAQEIQRRLEEVEEKQKELEIRGVTLEKALRGETADEEKEEDELLQEWFELVRERNELRRYEKELLVRAQEMELEDRHARLQQELREVLAKNDCDRTHEEVLHEGALLREMLDTVEKRDALTALLEQERQRYQEEDKDLEAQVLSKGLRLTPIRKYEYQSAV